MSINKDDWLDLILIWSYNGIPWICVFWHGKTCKSLFFSKKKLQTCVGSLIQFFKIEYVYVLEYA